MYTIPTLLVAAKVSFVAVLWLTVVIGAPIIWFGLEHSFVAKLVFFAVAQTAVWLVYFLVCLLVHRLSLNSPEKCQVFLAKNHKQQGKELGSIIEGF